jgi:membrane protein
VTPRKFLREVWSGIQKHRIPDLAAMMTYYAIFALFPFLLFLVNLTVLVLPASTIDDAFRMAAVAMPREVAQLAHDQLMRMQQSSAGGFAAVGAALAMWSASRGAIALQTALNQIHDVIETRPWWRVQLTAILVTMGVSFLALVAFALLAFGPKLGHVAADRLHLGGAFDLAWTIGRWVGAAILVMLVWGSLYYFLANIRRKFRWVTPGAVVGVSAWLAASRGFIFYTDHFGSYDKTYGTLGAVIVFLTWLWISNLCLLVGGEIDDTVDEIRRRKRTAAREQEQEQGKEGNVDKQIARARPGTAAIPASSPAATTPRPAIGDLARRIGEDVSVLARDHFELARIELGRGLRSGASDAAALVLGGVVALIGFAMLCTTAVVALGALGWPLWLRMLLMSLVYLVVGGGVVFGFARKLRGDVPRMGKTARQSRLTVTALKEQVQHG